MVKQKLDNKALGYGVAIVSAIGMVVTWLFGISGVYSNWVNGMMNMHMFFSLSFLGLITGILEATIWGFITGWLIAYFYNKF